MIELLIGLGIAILPVMLMAGLEALCEFLEG